MMKPLVVCSAIWVTVALNQSALVRECEIRPPFRIGLEPRPVGLVVGQAIERDQPPGHVARTFVWEEIPDEIAAAARDDARPIRCVLLERLALERVDFVADQAGDRHRRVP